MRPTFTLLSLCLLGASAVLAADKPNAMRAKLAAPREARAHEASGETSRRVAAEAATAIEALGANPSSRQIAAIVFGAVRNSPGDVLAIVDAAVRVSPQAAAPAIVTAATAAVPDPWKQVTYRRLTASRAKSDRDFKGGTDGKRIVDLDGDRAPKKGDGTRAGSSDPGGPMSLAEAIALTAFDAQPGLSLSSLQSAVDVALVSDPATLLRNIQSARSVTGVGDAGNSNYANEPLRTRVLGVTAVPAPNPPVVSR